MVQHKQQKTSGHSRNGGCCSIVRGGWEGNHSSLWEGQEERSGDATGRRPQTATRTNTTKQQHNSPRCHSSQVRQTTTTKGSPRTTCAAVNNGGSENQRRMSSSPAPSSRPSLGARTRERARGPDVDTPMV